MPKKIKIIILILIIGLLIILYFFIPINWTLGLRPPKDFKECMLLKGSVNILRNGGQKVCIWQDSSFDDKTFISPFK
jgi:hypothetical protein